MDKLSVMEKAVENLKNRKELAIVTITDAKGSTPRSLGSTMAVLKDGTIYGTIGGGSLERYIIDRALEYIKEGKSGNLNIPLNKEGVEMVCGGKVEVFINVYKNRPRLIIAGGGHVGLSIYKVASLLDFDIAIFEDRKEFLTWERFPQARELVLGEIGEKLSSYPIDNNTYIVIVTRGHKYDERVLEEVIYSEAKYIGAMGSRSKIKTIMDNLRAKNIPNDILNKVYAPIGLNICDGSPGEIAMAIMSEILMVKNGGKFHHRYENL